MGLIAPAMMTGALKGPLAVSESSLSSTSTSEVQVIWQAEEQQSPRHQPSCHSVEPRRHMVGWFEGDDA